MALCVLLVSGLVANGQEPKAVSLSQAEAVREFPALGQPGSNFNKRFVERYNSLKSAGDSLLLRDDWPELLAKEIGVELGIPPLDSLTANASTPAPTATAAPWHPLGTMLDQNPGTQTTSGETLLDVKPGVRYHIIGKVLQKVDAGLLVTCNDPPGGRIGKFATGIVLLRDSPLYDSAADGDSIKCWGTQGENYSYDSVNGSGSTVHSYEYSQ